MTTHMTMYAKCLAGGILLGLLAGCTDLKPDLPAPTSAGPQAHEKGWNDSTSASFHGRVLKTTSYRLSDCTPCHAQSFKGGTSNVSCFTCHTSFPHGAGWADSAAATFHGRYLAAKDWAVTECASCHGAAFDGGTSGKSCFTCHASFPHPAGWNSGGATFHGNFISTNAWDMRPCKTCHGEQYDGGRTEVSCRTCHTGGSGPENCTTCHGSANPAPPRDLSGNTSRSAKGVGAHQAHLVGPLKITGTPLPCTACHDVNGAVYDPGHIDATPGAEVPMSISLARIVTNEPGTEDYDATLPLTTPNPSYTRSSATCGNTYCHGTFKNGNPGYAPVWNDTTGTQAACGTCHGDITRPTLAEKALPRTDLLSPPGTHPNVLACYGCHGDVVDQNLRIIDPSKHINGRLNVYGVERDF